MPSSKPHYRLVSADAISAHDRALRIGGGRPGMPRPELVESAIERPYSGYYETLAEKAAALTESMACNHGFLDGNKRTTLILVYDLIRLSGFDLIPIGNEDLQRAIEILILDVIDHKLEFAEIVRWFDDRLRAE